MTATHVTHTDSPDVPTGPPEGRRVAYLSLQAPHQWQGAYTHVHRVVEGLERIGWDVALYEPAPRHTGQRRAMWRRLADFFLVQLRLWRTAGDIDAVYVRHHPAAFLTAMWALLRRVPRIEEVNGPLDDYFLMYPWARRAGWAVTAASRTTLRTAAGVVTVTEALAAWTRDFVRNDTPPVTVIPNGVDVDVFHPEAAPKAPLPDRYVVFVGALSPWQGIDTMLTATEHPDWPPGVHLVIVGDGRLRDLVQGVSRARPLVDALGPIAHSEVPGLIGRSLASLSPKTQLAWHQSPLKLYEGLACGVPVIVTDIGEQARLVRETNCGIVVPVNDPGALARAVAQLARAPKFRGSLGNTGREAAVKNHTWMQRSADVSDVLLRAVEARLSP